MSRPRFFPPAVRWPLWCALAWLLPAAVQGGVSVLREVTDPKTNTLIEIVNPIGIVPSSGFVPLRVTLANGMDRPQIVNLEFSTPPYGRLESASAKSSFRLAAKPNERITRDILVPVSPSGGVSHSYNNHISLQVSGTMLNTSAYLNSSADPELLNLLISSAVLINHTQLIHDASMGLHSSSGNPLQPGTFLAPELPADWMAYSGIDALMISAEEWLHTSAAARAAISDWLRLGGNLILFHPPEQVPEPGALGIPTDAGFGKFVLMADSADPPALHSLLTSIFPRAQESGQSFTTDFPLLRAMGERDFNFGIFATVLLAFSIVVGPVNLFVFAKRGRRHRLFLTTPLISLTASVVLIALILIQDGTGGSGRRIALIEVDPRPGENQWLVHQEQASRTGMMTGNRFQLEPEAMIRPVRVPPSRWSRFDANAATGTFEVDVRSDATTLAGDWFQSRSEQGQIIDAVAPSRGKIARGSTPGSFVSTFDFSLETFYYSDQDGHYQAHKVSPGKEFTPEKVDPVEFHELVHLTRYRFGEVNRDRLEQVIAKPGHFLAVTDAAPGIASHPDIEWTSTHTVLTGIVPEN